MTLTIDSLVIFNGDTGLSLQVYTNRNSNGRNELGSVVDSLELHYRNLTSNPRTHIPREPKPSDEGGLLYRVLSSTNGYIGTVMITPQGISTKTQRREHEDYAIADPTLYRETYWINFYPADKSRRREHRDGYAKAVDPFGYKTIISQLRPRQTRPRNQMTRTETPKRRFRGRPRRGNPMGYAYW